MNNVNSPWKNNISISINNYAMKILWVQKYRNVPLSYKSASVEISSPGENLIYPVRRLCKTIALNELFLNLSLMIHLYLILTSGP